MRHLRQDPLEREVIVMSSFISRAERKQAFDLGVNALLEKPFRLSELVRMVDQLAVRQPIDVAR